jgi:hypothetical protein
VVGAECSIWNNRGRGIVCDVRGLGTGKKILIVRDAKRWGELVGVRFGAKDLARR